MKKYLKTVACLMFFGEKVMLAKRLLTHTFPGFYECVGGKIDNTDKSITFAIQRELLEEAGCYIPSWNLNIIDCIITDPTTDKCFIFNWRTHYQGDFQFLIKNKERNKRTSWQLYTIEEARALNNLMPGLRENLVLPD